MTTTTMPTPRSETCLAGGLNHQSIASRLQISIPSDLYRGNGYPHEEALFGIPKYGGTIAEVSKKKKTQKINFSGLLVAFVREGAEGVVYLTTLLWYLRVELYMYY